MLPSPVQLALLLSLAACGGRDQCPEAVESVSRDTLVGGTSAEALYAFVHEADQSIALVWNDGSATSLRAELTVGRESGQAVNSPLCVEACTDPELVPVGSCGPDWLVAHAAGVLWTDDGRLDGEPMVGRALAMGNQWRLDLVPARGASVQGSLLPYELVELPADTVEWSLGATLVGGGPNLLLAEIRVTSRQVVGGESSSQEQRLGVTP